jgi:hypothetical protein
MIIVSETKHVQAFIFKQLLNINKYRLMRFSLYPKAGQVPEAFASMLSFGFVIPNDLVDGVVQIRCRKMYAMQSLERLSGSRRSSHRRSQKTLTPGYPEQDLLRWSKGEGRDLLNKSI